MGSRSQRSALNSTGGSEGVLGCPSFLWEFVAHTPAKLVEDPSPEADSTLEPSPSPLWSTPGISVEGALTSLNLEIALPHLIARCSSRGHGDRPLGRTKAFELGLDCLPGAELNQLSTALFSGEIPAYLRESIETKLNEARLPLDVLRDFFSHIEGNQRHSLAILRAHLLRQDARLEADEMSARVVMGEVLFDPTLPNQLVDACLLRPAISSLLTKGTNRPLLSFWANDGEAILPCLPPGSSATLCETDPARFVRLERAIRAAVRADSTKKIDLAWLSLEGALVQIGHRQSTYGVVVLPELSQRRECNLDPALVSVIGNLVARGGVILVPYDKSSPDESRAESSKIAKIANYLRVGGFKDEIIERELTIFAPQGASSQALGAFIDLVYYARSRDTSCTRAEVKQELASYRCEDGSYRYRLHLCLRKFTQLNGLNSNWDPTVQSDKSRSKEGFTNGAGQIKVFGTTLSDKKPVVPLDSGVSLEFLAHIDWQHGVTLPEGLEIVKPQWPQEDDILALQARDGAQIDEHLHLIHREPNMRGLKSLLLPERWADFYRAERDLWDSLLILWPVQRQLLQMIVDGSSTCLDSRYHQRGGRRISSRWFEVAEEKLWPLVRSDARALMDNTTRLVERVAESVSTLNELGVVRRALAVQLCATWEYLRRINVPFDYRRGESDRIMSLPPEALTNQDHLKAHIQRLTEKSREAEAAIAYANKSLIFSVLKQFNQPPGAIVGERLGELVAAGWHGLTRAVALFSFEREFSTYAWQWIEGKIRTCRKQSSWSRGPAKELGRLVSKLTQEIGHPPTDEEILDELVHRRGLSRDRAESAIKIRSIRGAAAAPTLSLDAPIGHSRGDGETLVTVVEETRSARSREDLKGVPDSLISEFLRSMPRGYRELSFLRFKMGLTHLKMARVTDVSQQRINQKMSKVLDLVASDSNPAYRRLLQYQRSGVHQSAEDTEEVVYLTEVLNDPMLLGRLAPLEIFTLKQLAHFSAMELGLSLPDVEALCRALRNHDLTLATSVRRYDRCEISRKKLDWLPAPVRAKTLMGFIAEADYKAGPLSSLFEHWISVLPAAQRVLVSDYLPHSVEEGFRGEREAKSITKNYRLEVLGALSALGHSACPTVAPVYRWIERAECPDIQANNIPGLLSTVFAEDGLAIWPLISRGIFTLEQLVQVPEARLRIIDGLTRAGRKQILNRVRGMQRAGGSTQPSISSS